jgi:type I restriction enzyme S subunit
MNAELLLAHYDRISDAPDAVERLRKFVYRLAISGRLTEQMAADKSVSELVNQLELARRKQQNRSAARTVTIDANEQNRPLECPAYWGWLPLRDVVALSGGMTPSKARHDFWEGEIPWFSPKDVKSSELFSSELKISSAGLIETGLQLYPPGCLFVVARSGILKRTLPVSISRVEATVNQDLKVLRPFIPNMERYLQILFMGMTDYILSDFVKTGTTVQSLKYEEFESMLIPLPPFAEQHRIVAKVDELMALCDRLEAARHEQETRREQLTASAHHHLNNGENEEELRTHARFFIGHLPRLTKRPNQIKQLRQTILNLAVCGKVAPQNSEDEPASELMRRIRAAEQRLLRDGVIKKLKTHENFSDGETPFSLPSKWKWVRLNAIVDVQDPNPSHRMPQYVHSGGIPFISSENFVENDQINFQIGKQVTQRTLDEQITRFPILPGALAFTRIGTIGKSRFLPAERYYGISHAVCVLNPLDQSTLSMQFLRYAMGAEAILAFAHKGTRSIGVPDLGMGVVRNMALPLPPLSEQHRIVAKVDELMALCDKLEVSLSSTQTDTSRLLESVLHHALEASA